MEEAKKLGFVVLVLISLIALSFPFQQSHPGGSMSWIQLEYEEGGNTIEVIVSGFQHTYQKQVDTTIDPDTIDDGEPGSGLADAYYSVEEISPVEGAQVNLYFTNVTGQKVYITECNPVLVDTPEDLSYGDEVVTIYKGSCTVPEEYYHEDCILIYGELHNSDAITSSNAASVCDPEGVAIFDKLTSKASEIILAYAADPSRNYLCILSFVLLGTMVASMYYSGRSPLSLLDLTSPKLPSPKAIAASGVVLAPMSYGRMKSAMSETGKSLSKFFGVYNKDSLSALTGRMAAIGRLISSSGAPEHLRALANRAARRAMESPGGSVESARQEVTRILSCYEGGKMNLRALRRILNEFNARGGVDKSMAAMSDLTIMGNQQLQHMSVYSGGTEAGKSSWLQRGVGGLVKMTESVPLVGLFLGSAISSNLFGSFQFAKRIGRSIASSAANAVLPLHTTTEIVRRGQQRARAAGKDEFDNIGGFAGFLAETHETATVIGRHWRVDEKVPRNYEDLDREALLGVERHVFNALMRAYGVDHELTGRMDGETLLAEGRSYNRLYTLIDNQARSRQGLARLRSLDESLVAIFRMRVREGESEHNYHLRRIESLRNLVAQLRARGVAVDHLDDAGVDRALSELNRIHNLGETENGRTVNNEERWVCLTEYLRRANEEDPTGGFYHTAGRTNLWYEDGTLDHWNMQVFKSYLESAEDGNLRYTDPHESLYVNVMKENFLKFIANEHYSFHPDYATDEQRAILQKAHQYLLDLVADDAALQRYGTVRNADGSITLDPTRLLYNQALAEGGEGALGGGDWREGALPEGWWKVNMKWFWHIPGSESMGMGEHIERSVVGGPVRGLFERADREQHVPRFEDRARRYGAHDRAEKRRIYALGFLLERMQLHMNEDANNVYGESFELVSRTYNTTYAEQIRRYLRYYAEDPSYRQVSDRFRNMNAEEVMNEVITNERVGRLRRGGVLTEEMIRAIRDGRTHSEVSRLRADGRLHNEDIEHIRRGHLSDFSLRELRENFLTRPITYDVWKKGVWGRNNEGALVPYNEEVPMSSMDIALNAVIAYRDPKGRLREYKSGHVDIDAEMRIARRRSSPGEQAEIDNFAHIYGVLRRSGHEDEGEKDRNFWNRAVMAVDGGRYVAPCRRGEEDHTMLRDSNGNPISFLGKARELAERGLITGGALAAISHDYAHTTGDWSQLGLVRNRDTGEKVVRLMSQHDFLQQREYMLGNTGRWLSEKRWQFGHAVERNLINVFKANALAMDSINQMGMFYRQRYHELAVDVLGGGQAPPSPSNTTLTAVSRDEIERRARERARAGAHSGFVDQQYSREYRRIAQGMARYYTATDFTVDRHPSGVDTSQGTNLYMGAFYHMGPHMAFSPDVHDAIYTRSQKSAMLVNNILIKFGRHFMRTPVASFREFKRLWEGRGTNWEWGDTMNKYLTTRPQKIKSARALLTPSYAGTNVESAVRRGLRAVGLRRFVREDPRFFKSGEVIQKGILGDHTGRATSPSINDFNRFWENVAYAATIGSANPSSFYLTMRRSLRPDVSTAEQLVYRRDMRDFYRDDYVLNREATTNVVKREASSILHTMERKHEIEHDSISGEMSLRRLSMIAPVALASIRKPWEAIAGTIRDRRQYGADARPRSGREFIPLVGHSGAATAWMKRTWQHTKEATDITRFRRPEDTPNFCKECGAQKPRNRPCTNARCRSNVRRRSLRGTDYWAGLD